MSIEALVTTGKISHKQAQVWELYCGSQIGQSVLMEMMHDTFMDEPPISQFNGTGFAFFDGRRSIFRDITRTIQFVENQLKGLSNEQRREDIRNPKPRKQK